MTCSAGDEAHSKELVEKVRALEGVEVHKVSDRTFLIHLGGKIEVTSKVPLKTRDDLSMAYTPGVGRVSMAIYENPDDVSRLTIKATRWPWSPTAPLCSVWATSGPARPCR